MAIRRFAKLLADLKRKSKTRAKDLLDHKPRRLDVQRLEERALMATIPVQIDPQPGRVLDNTVGAANKLTIAPTEILFDFEAFGAIRINGVTPQQQTAELANSIKLVRAGFDNNFANGVVPVDPGFLGIGDQPYKVIMRFKDPLPDDKYQFQIVGTGPNALTNSRADAFNGGIDVSINMDLELGPKVIAVVPQPITRNASSNNWLAQDDKKVIVYFEKGDELLDAASVQTKEFYQFYATRNSLDPNDQVLVNSTTAINNVVYDTALNAAVITFNQSLYSLGLVADDGTPDPVKSFRLRIGTNETRRQEVNVQALVDPDTALLTAGQSASTLGPGWSFATAYGVGNLTGAAGSTGESRVFSQAIDTQYYGLTFPGGDDDPGHRNFPYEDHYQAGLDAFDTQDGIRTQYYNFRKEISDISGGQTGTQRATNNITDKQKELARQIFDMYSRISGIQFIERISPSPLESLPASELDDIVVATGDFRVFNDTSEPGGTIGLAGTEPIYGLRLALMDGAETWNELQGDAPYEGSAPGQLSWFNTATHEIGHLLGLGHSYDLPERTVQGDDPALTGAAVPETIIPGDADQVHMQYMYRPESKDIDMYQFSIAAAGTLTLETMAERLHNSSTLDTYLTVWRERTVLDTDPLTGASIIDPGTGAARQKQIRELVARNDDYYSKDSALEIKIDDPGEFGTYYVGVSAKGNDSYDPTIADSGMNGTTSGRYELRMDFQRDVDATRSIKDAAGSLLDGDGDGVAGGASNFWFRTAKPMEGNGVRLDTLARTIFVEKTAPRAGSTAGYVPNGSLQRPFHDIDDAIAAAKPFDIIRIVGNPGADSDITKPVDATAYKIGFDPISGLPLEDGVSLSVPKDVTVMIDAGAVFQAKNGWISVGSTSPAASSDRSGAALQILGTPTSKVYFTSFNEQGTGFNKIGLDQNNATTTPQPGDWGGISFHNDVDKADGRFQFEDRGVFLNYVNFADIRYGGGDVLVEGPPAKGISPIRIVDSRPTITNNLITSTRDAAMSANPNSFEETNFHAPKFYKIRGLADPVTADKRLNPDYKRVGPEIRGNSFVRFEQLTATTFSTTPILNTLNGIFIRSSTPAGNTLEEMTIAGRFDDIDIVHILSENLIVSGTAGGARWEKQTPTTNLVTARIMSPTSTEIGRFNGTTSYEYRLTFVDAHGNESPASAPISRNPFGLPLQPNASGQFIRLSLPEENSPPEGSVGRRVYRSVQGANDFRFIGTAPPKSAYNFNDYNFPNVGLQQVLQDSGLTEFSRARLDGSLVIDPRIIVKAEGSRIEIESGANLIAEGVEGREVVFTSQSDHRWGAGGTFDTRGDNGLPSQRQPVPGDWAGIEARPDSSLSIDQAILAYGGGLSRIEGALTGINVIEVLQADARIANSTFEFNDNGIGGEAPVQREGRGGNAPAVIFVRGAQPTIVNNTLTNNLGALNAAISINVNALNSDLNVDLGRQRPLNREVINPVNNLTIDNDRVPDHYDNHGPLVVGNRMANNSLNGMVVRGGILTTESVWDDTDIHHILLDRAVVDTNLYLISGQVIAPDLHTYGGLRLVSHVNESLVVKASGQNAGLVANGRPLEIDDRIGGTIQILGQPNFPVILTSLSDDSVTAAAGTRPDGTPQTDTDNNNQPLVLTPGPEQATGATIDNDLVSADAGFMSMPILDGGEIGVANNVSVPFGGLVLQNNQFVNQFLNYVRVGTTTTSLRNTAITQTATRQGTDDIVTSTGSFAGSNGTVTWTVESRIAAGKTSVVNTIKFSSTAPLGNLQFINLMDANIGPGVANDVLYRMGSGPGQSDFRLATLDDARRYGIAQGGVYQADGTRLQNATWSGFAGNMPANLIASVNSVAGQTFSPTGTVTGLPQRSDVSLGNIWGNADISSAMAWTVDGTALSATITTFLDLVPVNPVNAGTPGEWRGILLDEYSNDRNVETIIEAEQAVSTAVDRNPNSDKSQLLGYLASNEKSGDDNLRLGFTVQGTLRSASDIDVYTFFADAGTEVWLDMDRTWNALDTVVELIDDLGNKQLLSNNSWAEDLGAEAPFEGNDYQNSIRKMQKVAPYDGKDFYQTNPRDAGFRVTLSGPPGQHKYHIRVRSANPNVLMQAGNVALNPDTVDGIGRGLTKGAYQLQLRLREADEFGGSAVRYADIRNAIVGIDVRGLPVHSPLTGEVGEVANENNLNDTRANATQVGNLLERDRGTISIGGALGGVDAFSTQGRIDIDWYRFEITPEAIQGAAAGSYPVEIDADFADNIGRPNINMYLYDVNGRLIVASVDANVSDDRPSPNNQQDFADLSRGSGGGRDALIGPVGLPVGTYYLAVTNNGATPNALNNTTTMRLEPINSTQKIVEDRINNYFLPETTAERSKVTDLFDDNGASSIPFHLGDVSMFVAQEETALREGTRIYMVDPFTGGVETELRNADGSVKIGFDVGDIAFRPNNQLMTYELDEDAAPADPEDDAEAGRYYEIDSGLGSVTQRGADGIETDDLDPAGAPRLSHTYNGAQIGWGINFYAMAFGDVARNLPGERLLAVGHRGDQQFIGQANDPYDYIPSRRNILYTMTPATGAYQGTTLAMGSKIAPDENPPALNYPGGAYTPQTEVGEIPVQPILSTIEATRQRAGNGLNNFIVQDGQTLQVNDGRGLTTYELDSGPELLNEASFFPNVYTPDITLPAPVYTSADPQYYIGNTIVDGDFFVLDPTLDVGTQANTLNDETLLQFDSGVSIVFNTPVSGSGLNSPAGQYDGQTITVTGTLGRSVTFEFDADGVPVNGNTVLVVIGLPLPGSQPPSPSGNLNVGGLAGALVTAINAQIANLGISAVQVGNRVSFIDLANPGSAVDVVLNASTNLFSPTAYAFSPFMSFEGSSGLAPVLKFPPASYSVTNVPTGNTVPAGSTITFNINLNGPLSFTYRYIVDGLGGPTPVGQVAVAINSTDSPLVVAQKTQAAINGDPAARNLLFTKLAGDKLLVNGSYRNTATPFTTTAGNNIINMSVANPAFPNMARAIIRHEEGFPIWVPRTPANPNPISVDQAVQTAVNNFTNFVAGADVNRINFPNFSSAPFTQFGLNKKAVASLQDISIGNWFPVANSATGVTAGNIAVPFLADDGNNLYQDPSAVSVGDRIATAVNFYQPGLNAVAQVDRVTITNGAIIIPGVANNPTCAAVRPTDQFYSCGEGPGGIVTGMANLRGEVYVVTSAGGLYHVLPDLTIPGNPPPSSSLIPNNFVPTQYVGSTETLGINFQGLTPGPQTTENGRYRDMLFAVDDNGRVYALGTVGAQSGRLQSIFNDGASYVDTGVTDARGIAFSSLNENLWQRMPSVNAGGPTERQEEIGHGPDIDGFGPLGSFSTRAPDVGLASYHFGNIDRATYNFPGGAHGTVISNEFSLKGYSSGDQPVMYFDYFSASGADDDFRVSVSDNGGDWQQVFLNGTQNSGNWHQARISMQGFAGLENLRLRLDFVTGGDLDLGATQTHGDELTAVDARYIADGDSVVLTDGTFEFDSGYSLQLPSGAGIAHNSTIQVASATATITLRLIKVGTPVGPLDVLIRDADTPREVADKIAAAITANLPGVNAWFGNSLDATVLDDNIVNFENAVGMQVSAGSGLILLGSSGFRIVTQNGANIVDGETFVLRDGVNPPLTIEFDNNGVMNAPAANRVRVGFTATDTAAQVAQNIRIAVVAARPSLAANLSVSGFTVVVTNVLQVVRTVPGNIQLSVNGVTYGNVRVPIHRGMDRRTVGQALRTAMEANYQDSDLIAVTGDQLRDGMTFSLSDGFAVPVVFEFDSGYIMQIPTDGANPVSGNPANYIEDGDQVILSDGTTTIIFEFDNNGAWTAGPNVYPITINNTMTQLAVARLMQSTIQNAAPGGPLATAVALLGIDGTAITNGRVQLGGRPTGVPVTFDTGSVADRVKFGVPSLPTDPRPGVVAGRQRIFYREYSGFTAINVAAAIEQAIDASPANTLFTTTIDPATPYRISLVRQVRTMQTTLMPTNTSPIQLIAKSGQIKGYRDLVNVIGRDVVSEGPLGFDDYLPDDPPMPLTNPPQPDAGINDDPTDAAHFLRRGQDNNYEGVYIDDIVVGFIERGAAATYNTLAGSANDTFTIFPPPFVPINNEGPYQIEIRRSAVYGTPVNQLSGTPEELARTFDTNDRVTKQIQLVSRPGANIADGQTFTLGDGNNYVTFEFNDATIVPASGVTQGNLVINYLPSDTEEAIARKIRDAINGPDAKAALKFSAATSDGLAPFDTTSTDNRINVHGSASTQIPAHAAPEPNDLAPQATPIDLGSADKPVYFVNGTIGDRRDLQNAFLAGQDVDLFSIDLQAGQRIYLDIDASSLGSTLDSVLRVFQRNAGGTYTQLAISNDNGAPGESTPGTESYLEFLAPATGSYLIGVSASGNGAYNPVTGAGVVNAFSTGFYQLEVNAVLPSSIDVTVFDDQYGDSNQFRDQGQLIIRDNIISNSSSWGISIDAALRTAVDGNAAHPGSVRYTPQINNNNLAPGVVVTNNIIARNQGGGILFSGDPNLAGQGTAPVPFGRILNNTLFGVGGTLADSGINDIGISVTDAASPTLMNNILANFDQAINIGAAAANLGTIVKSTVYQGNVVNSNIAFNGDLATVLANTDPLFVNAPANNFYLAKFSLAIDSASKSLLDRSELERVRAPLGITTSPIIAPDNDIYGSKRVDDGSSATPNGLGDNKFTDRGAVERSDFTGPSAGLVYPADNGPDDRDQRTPPPVTVALPDSFSLDRFEIQFVDIDGTTGANTGTGIDDATVTSEVVILRDITDPANPILLVDGVDYFFVYNATTNTITLLPIGVEFPSQRTYEIELDINNSIETDLTPAIRDRAGNLLQPNFVEGTSNVHKYTISLGTAVDFGDAPSTYLTTRAQDGPRHDSDGAFFLGNGITLEGDGSPSPTASSDNDDGITLIPGALVVNGQSSFIATASGVGKLDVWLDLNNDGTFATFVSGGVSVSEHIGTYDITQVGVPVQYIIPQGIMARATGGSTFARFRLTTAGINTPTGPAPDGEVEDYQVNILAPPFRNPNPFLWQGQYGLDVDNNGIIEGLDLLWIVHLFAQRQSSGIQLPSLSPPNPLPNVPLPTGIPSDKYYDVNGDNVVDPQDVLALIFYFASSDYRNGFGGEGESSSSSLVAAAPLSEPKTVEELPAVMYASSSVDVEVKTPASDLAAVDNVVFTGNTNDDDALAALVLGARTSKEDDSMADLLLAANDDALAGPVQSLDDSWDDLVDLLAEDKEAYGPL